MFDNSQEFPIIVTYYTNSKIISKKEFGSFAHFGSILNYFERYIKTKGLTKLKKKYILNGKEIDINDILINLIQPSNKNKKIISANLFIEIEEKNNFVDKNSLWFTKLLQPKADPFGIYIFNPKDYSIALKRFTKKEENDNELNAFNENSAYCNSIRDLYISGGNYLNKELNNFWIINNEYFTIKKIHMIYPKSNHSMIYVNNNYYEIIFIVGGKDTKSFYYDIKNNKFINWGNTNYLHVRPALIFINDYIYCFDYSPKNKIIFERTNINDVNKKWEKIVPNFENENITFTNSGFAASLCGGGKILFCGGDTININTYLYDIDKNLIDINDKNDDILFSFKDKNFYKINYNSNIALPNSLEEEKEILICNRNDYSIKQINITNKDKDKNKQLKNIFNKKYKNTQEIIFGNVNIDIIEEDIPLKENKININKEKNKIKNKSEININIGKNEDNFNIDDNYDNNSYYEKKIETKNKNYKNIKPKEEIKDTFKNKNKENLYISNNDNFTNYKKEKNIEKEIIYDVGKQYNKTNKINNLDNFDNEKNDIILNYNDNEDIYEPEGNNFIYDSNLNKFNDIKKNNNMLNIKKSQKKEYYKKKINKNLKTININKNNYFVNSTSSNNNINIDSDNNIQIDYNMNNENKNRNKIK